VIAPARFGVPEKAEIFHWISLIIALSH